MLTLLTKAIAMSTSAAQLRPFRSCSLALGCSVGPLPSLPRFPEGRHGPGLSILHQRRISVLFCLCA